MVFPDAEGRPGRCEYLEPMHGRQYAIGADPSGGSQNGDYSAFACVDVSDTVEDEIGHMRRKYRLASTFYEKMPPREFALVLYHEGMRYNVAMLVPEANSGYGAALLEALVELQYPNLYMRRSFDRFDGSKNAAHSFGFWVDQGTRAILLERMRQSVATKRLDPCDERLQNEINSFIFIDGKPQAEKRRHDDMIMAVGLALMGIDYNEVGTSFDTPPPPPLHDMREMLKWEARHGRYQVQDDDLEGWCAPSEL
jgi:hypothetical protein